MGKIRIYAKMLLKLILVFISIIGVTVSGEFLSEYIPYNNVFLIITIVLLVINVTSNFIVNRIDSLRLNKKKTGDQLINFLLKTKEEALKNPEAIRSRILRKYTLTRLYSYVTLLLMYVIMFLCPVKYGIPMLMIFMVFMYFYSIANAKRVDELEKNKFYDSTILDERQFKDLYDIVNKAVSYHNIKKRVVISYNYSVQLSISENDKNIIIYIGYYIVRLLNKKELEAAVHHEMAHFINDDTNYSLKYSKLSSSILYLSNSLLLNFFYAKIYSLTFETELLNYLSSIFFERKADEIINEVGCNQDFINGLAKVYIYDLYYTQYLEDTTLGRFDDVHYNIFDIGYNDFLRYYNNNKEYIGIFLEKSIVGRFDTHPSIVERKENLNVSEIEISFENEELKYLADLIEDKFIKENKEEIERKFKTERDIYLKALKEYESINDETKQEELISIGLDLFNLSLYERALIVCDKILGINPNQPRACFIKGAILLNLHHNEEGTEYLIKLIEENQSEYLKDSMYILGSYYASIGDKEMIEKLRNMQVSAVDNDMDYEELSKISPKDNLMKVIEDEGINMVINAIKNSYVENVIVAKKTINNKHMIHVILVFNDDETNENVDKISNIVWSTLDAINDVDYYLNRVSVTYYNALKWLHPFEVYKKN